MSGANFKLLLGADTSLSMGMGLFNLKLICPPPLCILYRDGMVMLFSLRVLSQIAEPEPMSAQ